MRLLHKQGIRFEIPPGIRDSLQHHAEECATVEEMLNELPGDLARKFRQYRDRESVDTDETNLDLSLGLSE